MKGRSEAIAVYEVLDAEVEEIRQLKIQTQKAHWLLLSRMVSKRRFYLTQPLRFLASI